MIQIHRSLLRAEKILQVLWQNRGTLYFKKLEIQ